MAAMPNGTPSFLAIARGCLAFWPFIAFHSKIGPRLDATSLVVGLAERRQAGHRLALGKDAFAAPLGAVNQ
jgi:hypothetical protein